MTRKLGWKLNTILSVQFLAVSTIPVVATALLILFLFSPRIAKNIEQEHLALSRVIAGQVNTQLSNAANDLQMLLALLKLDATVGVRRRLLDTFATNQHFYEAIYWLNGAGQVVDVGLPESKQPLRLNFIGLDMSRKPFFEEAVKEGTNVWSETFLSAVGGRLSVAYAIPQDEGVLVGEIAVDELPNIVADIAEKHAMTVMILDQFGQLIAHPDERLSQQQINLTNIELVKRSLAGEIVSLPFRFYGQSLFGTGITMENPRWLIIASQPAEVIMDKRRPLTVILSVAMLIGLLGAAVMAALVTRALNRRFRGHAKQAQALAEGKYQLEKAQPSRIIEFQQLSEDLIATGQAIEEREKELVTREKRFRTLVEQSPMAIIEWDTRYELSVYNPAARELLHLGVWKSGNEHISQNFHKLAQAVKKQLDQAERGTQELTLSYKPGQPLTLMIYSTTLKDSANRNIGYLSLIQNITEQRASERAIRELNIDLEQHVEERTHDLSQINRELRDALRNLTHTKSELVRSEKLAALGALVAGIAHELNTPIGNSLMATTSMRDEGKQIAKDSAEGRLTRSQFDSFIEGSQKGLDIVFRNLTRASELICSFKQVAVDQSSSQKRPFELGQMVQEVLTTLHPMLKKSVVKVVTNIAGAVHMNSYPGALGQVLTNLIQNALVHAFDGRDSGQITIDLSNHTQDMVTLVVRDNGAGIPLQHQGSIFDPFYTTKLGRGGSGLGLNIVHGLVHNVLRGKIKVSSVEGVGTAFTLELPLEVAEPLN